MPTNVVLTEKMIGFEGAVVLSKALKTNTTLSKITLDGDIKDTFIEKTIGMKNPENNREWNWN